MNNNKLLEIESVLDNIEDGIITKYKDYQKYNDMTIHILLKYSRAKVVSPLIKNKQDDLVKQYIQYYSKCDLLEMMIDYFFEDVPYNFINNLKEMLNYMKDNSDFVPQGLKLYKALLSFNDLSIDEIKSLFNKYKLMDTAKMFYQDYRLARNMAYQTINDKLLKIGHNITYLNGEDFYLCIHASNRQTWDINEKVLSLSLISNNNISHFGNKTRHIFYGFSHLKIDHIIHLYHADSYSSYTYGTDKIQRILNPDRLIKETGTYNEIFYKLDKSIYPDLLICFDKITDLEKKIADDMNLKLVVINTQKYLTKTGKESVLINNYIDEEQYQKMDYDILAEIKKMR